MKRNLKVYALLISLFFVLPAKAQNNNLNLNEIALTTKSESQNLDFMDDYSPLNSERLLQYNVDNKKEEQESTNKTVPVMDLKGGVQKTSPSAQTKGELAKTTVDQWLNGNYATGRWFGARPMLEDHGVTINSSLLYGPWIKTGGGANGEGSGKGYSLFNLSVTVDTQKAGLWKGGTFYALYQKKTGYGIGGPTNAMGDWMYLDGWDERQINQISEYWYQQKLLDGKVRLKFGKQDANYDFGYLNSGWDFMNLAFSVNPTVPMPTYPDQSFGFMAEINPKEWLSIRDGIYSRFNVPFNITEIEVKSKIKKMPGRYSIGAWEMSDSTGFDVAQSYDYNTATTYYNTYNRNFGAYAQFEQMVYKEKKDDDNDMQGLVVFGQFGVSPSNRNDMSRYVGGGLHYKGLIPKRDNDIAGIAVASGNFASRLADITSQIGDETAIEAFYKVQLTPWVYIQPDVQFISRPNGNYESSVAIGLRTVVTF